MSEKEWTIMIYMAGDNNLAVDMAYAMEQIKGVAGDGAESPNLFVYYDGNSPSIPTLYCDFSDPQEPKYVRSFMVPDKLHDVPDKHNENAADDKSVLNFVNWCVNQVEVVNETGEITNGRRAKKYALIFSGHSLGFQDIGLFRDESSGKAMKMTDLYYLLRRITGDERHLENDIKGWGLRGEKRDSYTRVLLGQKLDILGFDSCVMGMLEVGYQFNDVAKVMVASEGSVPNAGWTYAKLLGCLARDKAGDGTAVNVAESFVRDFIKGQDSYTVGGVSVDMAAWDLNCLKDLAAAFDGLATVLIECFDDPASRIYRQMERVILQVHWKCQSYMYDQNVDLGDFCELLDRECAMVKKELETGDDLAILDDVQACCQTVLGELKKAVILSGFSGGGYQYSNGISVFFPWSREGYEVSQENYKSTWFAKESGSRKFYWNGFLKKYLYEVALRNAEAVTPDAAPGTKYRYESGIKFHETAFAMASAGNGATRIGGTEGSKIAGTEGSKIAGTEGSKIAGTEGSKIAGTEGSKIAGIEGSKIAGTEGSKIAGMEGSKIAGTEGSKIAGTEGSKIAGTEGSKIAGTEGSKIAGTEGSKIAGTEGSKIAGTEGSKIAGTEGSKLAGTEGSKLAGGGSNAFFNSLRLFKNVESRWNISGFTKRKDEEASASAAATE
ncbi:MAG TPA: clostripain-related cysteine peptidase [Pyrinomonadaceae bacterium]|nr:clostripain-related cysteine peptidase [Pyrinomonadaceae bacterium]